MFPFMHRFFGYNQINILPIDQHKTTFIYPWEIFPIENHHLVWRMSVQIFNELCLMHFTISRILCNLIWMTCQLIHWGGKTIQCIWEKSSSYIIIIIFSWICTSLFLCATWWVSRICCFKGRHSYQFSKVWGSSEFSFSF